MSPVRTVLVSSLVLSSALGCESGRVSSKGAPVTSAPARAPAAATATATASASPQASPPSRQPTVLKLKGGATLTVPARAVPRRKPAGLPCAVRGAHNFTLPGGRQRLL
ncbi:MAG: hypothetical protein JRI23_24320, partial [Deltaproteobacteria bacterium]|nr:hypothetical protein [Deltaproteobacteria bacterium]MBW2535125.1 hypothetical protein [Deltaproteobacteria bacterium]